MLSPSSQSSAGAGAGASHAQNLLPDAMESNVSNDLISLPCPPKRGSTQDLCSLEVEVQEDAAPSAPAPPERTVSRGAGATALEEGQIVVNVLKSPEDIAAERRLKWRANWKVCCCPLFVLMAVIIAVAVVVTQPAPSGGAGAQWCGRTRFGADWTFYSEWTCTAATDGAATYGFKGAASLYTSCEISPATSVSPTFSDAAADAQHWDVSCAVNCTAVLQPPDEAPWPRWRGRERAPPSSVQRECRALLDSNSGKQLRDDVQFQLSPGPSGVRVVDADVTYKAITGLMTEGQKEYGLFDFAEATTATCTSVLKRTRCLK